MSESFPFCFNTEFKNASAQSFVQAHTILVNTEKTLSGLFEISFEKELEIANQVSNTLNRWYYKTYNEAGHLWIPQSRVDVVFIENLQAITVDFYVLNIRSFGLEN